MKIFQEECIMMRLKTIREERRKGERRREKRKLKKMGINMGDQKTAVCMKDISVEVEVEFEVNIEN